MLDRTDPPYPPESLLFMDKTVEAMVERGGILLDLCKKVVTFRGRPVIDIGCGYGRMAYALKRDGFEANYLGLDIIKKHIGWVQENFTPAAPNFKFSHTDIKNDRYNPKGALTAKDLALPEVGAPDAIFLLSVFTHMYDQDICTYLDKIAAIMDQKSVLYSTFFLSNPEMRNLETLGKSMYPMKHRLSGHCWYYDEKDPLHAIAYDEGWVRHQLMVRGLYPIAIFYGNMAGRPGGQSSQDTIFIGKY